jgi:hypothetical protein
MTGPAGGADPEERERTFNEAQRLVAERLLEPRFAGFQTLRMNFSDRLWLVVTSPSGSTREFNLEEADSAESFATRILATLAPQMTQT